MTGTPVDNDTDMFKVIHHMDMCYATACKLVHEIDPKAKVGTNIANSIAYPASPRPEDVEECEKHKYFMGWGFTDIQTRAATTPSTSSTASRAWTLTRSSRTATLPS